MRQIRSRFLVPPIKHLSSLKLTTFPSKLSALNQPTHILVRGPRCLKDLVSALDFMVSLDGICITRGDTSITACPSTAATTTLSSRCTVVVPRPILRLVNRGCHRGRSSVSGRPHRVLRHSALLAVFLHDHVGDAVGLSILGD